MDHSTLMECGNYFVLCEHCNNITVYKFLKCHNCLKFISNDKYKQHLTMNKYDILIKALMNFEIDVLEDCYSMISIGIKGDKSYSPESYHICKKNNEYIYINI